MLRHSLKPRFFSVDHDAFRLQRRWLKSKDKYVLEEGEVEPFSPWLTKARVYTVVTEYERLLNVHRHTIKFNKKVIKQYADASEEHSEYCTHKAFADYLEYSENMECFKNAKEECKTLPEFLQVDLRDTKDVENTYENFFVKYYPQIHTVLPKKLADNWYVIYGINAFLEDYKRETEAPFEDPNNPSSQNTDQGK